MQSRHGHERGWRLVLAAAYLLLVAAGRPTAQEQKNELASRTFVDLPLKELQRAVSELHGLVPSEDQSPLARLLLAVGKNTSVFFQSLPSVTCQEDVIQQTRDPLFSIVDSAGYTYRYLALADKTQPEGSLKEYRTDQAGRPLVAGSLPFHSMLTIGFVGLPILLDAPYQGESRFRYLGKQVWEGRETDVIALAQVPGKAQPAESVAREGRSVQVFLQGIAWVNPTTNQLIALRTDLLQAVTEVGLQRETTLISFAPVEFKQLATPLILPRKVVVTAIWSGEIIVNTHSYSKYQLFSVTTKETKQGP